MPWLWAGASVEGRLSPWQPHTVFWENRETAKQKQNKSEAFVYSITNLIDLTLTLVVILILHIIPLTLLICFYQYPRQSRTSSEYKSDPIIIDSWLWLSYWLVRIRTVRQNTKGYKDKIFLIFHNYWLDLITSPLYITIIHHSIPLIFFTNNLL